MKENNLSKWLDSLTVNNEALNKIQIDSIEFLRKELLQLKSSEEWRHTNLDRFEKIFHLPVNKKSKPVKVYFNSIHNLEENSLPNGIEKLNEEAIKKYFHDNEYNNSVSKTILKAINNSINRNLIGLKVKGKEINTIEIIEPSEKRNLIASAILLIVEENSSVELLQVIEGSENSSHSHMVEIFLEKNATLNHGMIAVGKLFSNLLASVSIQQSENSNYSFSSFQEGWHFSRLEQDIQQPNGNADTNLKGLQIANEDNQLANHSFIKFNGPGGTVNQLQKSITNNSGHSIFKGLIEVPKIAQQTKASQLSKNLLLSSKAKVDTCPQLKITADDVQCNHGATISQLDDEEIFYLQSRGITIKEASNIILKGFCKEIIDSMPFNIQKRGYLTKYIDGLQE